MLMASGGQLQDFDYDKAALFVQIVNLLIKTLG